MSYRLVRVGRSTNGMLGLDEIFQELYQAGKTPHESLRAEMVERVSKDNYIPPRAEDEFAEALLREYADFCRAKSGSSEPSVRRQRFWHGFAREQIAWFPTIAEDLCDSCGKCIEICQEKVFGLEEGKVIVNSPYECKVSCDACARACPLRAISLPPPAILRRIMAT